MGISAGIGALAGEAAVGFGAAEAIGAGAVAGGLFGGAEAVAGGLFGGAEAAGAFAGAEAAGAFAGAEALGAGAFAGGAAELGAGALSGAGAEALGGFSGLGEFAGSEALGEFGASELAGSEAGFDGASSFDEAGFSGDDLTASAVSGFDEAGFEEFAGLNDFASFDEGGFEGADGQFMTPDNADFGARDQLRQYQPGPESPAGKPQAAPARDAVDEAFNPAATQAAPRGPGGNRTPAAAASRSAVGSFNPGSLLSGLMQMGQSPSRPPQQAAATGIAQNMADQGNLLISNYNQGLLSGPMMAQIKTALQGWENQINQFHAHNGTTKSTARNQALAQARLKATAAMGQALERELQQGLAFLGPAGNQMLQASQQTISSDNAYRQSLNNSLASILRIPFQGAGGQQQQQASNEGFDGGSGGSAYEGLEAA